MKLDIKERLTLLARGDNLDLADIVCADAVASIEQLEADIAASEHNFRTMRQLRNDAIDRIEQLEAALREISEGDLDVVLSMRQIARKALKREENDDVFKGFRGNNEA